MASGTRHYAPHETTDGGWTLRATGGGERDFICINSWYTSVSGEEGRCRAQARADESNAIAAARAQVQA